MSISPNNSAMLTEKKSEKEVASQTISFLRFPLIVAVVLIHSKFTEVVIDGVKQVETADYPVFSIVSYLVPDTFARVAVPLFFFFSGFLFFYNIRGRFKTNVYLYKLKKRAKTLLVPYIFWNLFMILFVLVCQTIAPSLMSGTRKLVVDYSLSDWLWNFWDSGKVGCEEGYPADAPLWFVRDLIVVILCSPLVYCIVRWLKHYGVILLGLAWFFGLTLGFTGFNIDAFFFFTFGAYFGINGKTFVTLLRPCMLPVSILYILLAIIGVCFRDNVWIEYIHLYEVNILLGMIVTITVTAHYVERGSWKVSKFLASSSFFVFACHEMLLASIIKIAFKLVQPHSDASLLVLYVLCPTLTILLGLSLFWVLRKILPRFTAVIIGGR